MGNVSLCYRPVARVRSDARKSQRHFVSLGDLGGRMLKEIADSQQQQDSSSSGDEDSRDSQQQQDRKGAAGQHRDTLVKWRSIVAHRLREALHLFKDGTQGSVRVQQ